MGIEPIIYIAMMVVGFFSAGWFGHELYNIYKESKNERPRKDS